MWKFRLLGLREIQERHVRFGVVIIEALLTESLLRGPLGRGLVLDDHSTQLFGWRPRQCIITFGEVRRCLNMQIGR